LVKHTKYSANKVVKTIKKNTIKALRIKFTFLEKVYWEGKEIWAKECFIFKVRRGEMRKDN
jgi:REP element-mobilizing transposase RayT